MGRFSRGHRLRRSLGFGVLGVDRSPCYARLSRAVSDEWDILVAEVDGEVAGFLESWQQTYLVRGEPTRVTYSVLAGVAPALRGQGILRRLMPEAEAAAWRRRSRMWFGLVNARNPKLRHTLTGWYRHRIEARPIVIH